MNHKTTMDPALYEQVPLPVVSSDSCSSTNLLGRLAQGGSAMALDTGDRLSSLLSPTAVIRSIEEVENAAIAQFHATLSKSSTVSGNDRLTVETSRLQQLPDITHGSAEYNISHDVNLQHAFSNQSQFATFQPSNTWPQTIPGMVPKFHQAQSFPSVHDESLALHTYYQQPPLPYTSGSATWDQASLNMYCITSPPTLSTPCYSYSNRSGKCINHEKPTVLYCEVCKIPICGLCGIFALGEHHDHPLKVKKYRDNGSDSRLDVLKKLNILVSDVCDMLQDLEVRIPFVLSVTEGHLLLEENVDVQNKDFVQKILIETNLAIRGISEVSINSLELNILLDELSMRVSQLNDSFKDEQTVRDIVPITCKNGGPSAMHCLVKGQGTFEVIANKETCFYLSLKNEHGNVCSLKDAPVDVNAFFCNSNTGKKVAMKMNSHILKGIVKLSFRFPFLGLYSISVRVNSMEVPSAPIKVYAKKESKFEPLMVEVSTIGDLESFNKPYGVVVDNQKTIYISDRCNNCVKVLNKDFTFKMSIGESGEDIGNFKKPSGLAIDKEQNLVVCDKDNHRIQVFCSKGLFIKSTEKKCGLSFPWSVAVNSLNHYIVTHDKNSVAIFNSQMKCLKNVRLQFKCGREGPGNLSLNPRGVCVGYMDEVLVSEFESGAVYSVNIETEETAIVVAGSSMYPNSEVRNRYQGITLDRDGYLLIADSKCCKIDVFTYSGEFVSSWKTNGKPMHVVEFEKNRYIVTVEDGCRSSVLIYAKSARKEINHPPGTQRYNQRGKQSHFSRKNQWVNGRNSYNKLNM